MSQPDTEVAIIGGGPAGSSMAAYLAQAGVRATVLESEAFPRPHVGESLVPASTRVFRDLGFLEQMEAHKFVHKHGAAWTSATSAHTYSVNWEALIRFDERTQKGVEQDYTYHVNRAEFDLALLRHASQRGAEVHEGARVERVDFEADRARVRYQAGGRPLELTAKIVVDASGRRTLLGNQLKLRQRDPVFDQFALHTWFEDYDRSTWAKRPEQRDFVFIHFLPLANTWMWQIPITDAITSIGVVTQRALFAGSRQEREAFFWATVGSRPEVAEKLRAARQLKPLSEEGDYSYSMRQVCGDRWLMVGDAARFVDPIFSTGVSIALNAARFGHADVLRALASGDCSRATFAPYEATLRRGTDNWYEFISIYYRLNVLFTWFVNDPRYRLDVLELLQGDVYDQRERPVLARMREMVAQVEQDPEHPWHALLSDLTGHSQKARF